MTRILAFSLLLMLLGCVETKTPSKYERMAKAYCECTFQLAQLNKEVEVMSADTSSRQDALAYFRKLEEEYNKAKECSGTIISQFGKLKPEDFPKLEQYLEKQCPDLSKQRDLLRELLGE